MIYVICYFLLMYGIFYFEVSLSHLIQLSSSVSLLLYFTQINKTKKIH